jgi:hydrogenase/urease accessory protein HupE
MDMNKFRSRKFLMSIGLIIIGTTALFTGFVTGSEFNLLSLGILGAYTAGNVSAKSKENSYD